MSQLKRITIDLELGQTILVGPNNQRAKITKIEYHPKTGMIDLNTTMGPRSALTFKLSNNQSSDNDSSNPADKFR